MSSLWLDRRYALRMMVRSPGLTAVLLITLAIGLLITRIPAVERAVAELDPALPIIDLRSMDDLLWEQIALRNE